MMKFLITRPEHDDTVSYLFEWSKELISHAEEKGLTVLDCERQKANRVVIEKMLEKQSPRLAVFNGHGNQSQICGHKDEILIEKDKNDELLGGKIVYARSCSTAKELGPSCIGKGALAYIGYKEDFAFVMDNFSSTKPLNDNFAKPFFLASNQVVHSLLNGMPAQEANKRSLEVFDQQIQKYLRSNAPPEAEHILPLLFWDKMNQVVLGEGNSKL